jgi:hypothetical protein
LLVIGLFYSRKYGNIYARGGKYHDTNTTTLCNRNSKHIFHANDRATLLNLFVAMNGFTLCSGIICENLNSDNYCAVRLDSDELMTVGYIRKKEVPLSPIGQMYIEELSKYKKYVLE